MELMFFTANFPFMEGYIRKMALKTEFAKHYLFIESETEDLLRKRLENENTKDVRILFISHLTIYAVMNNNYAITVSCIAKPACCEFH